MRRGTPEGFGRCRPPPRRYPPAWAGVDGGQGMHAHARAPLPYPPAPTAHTTRASFSSPHPPTHPPHTLFHLLQVDRRFQQGPPVPGQQGLQLHLGGRHRALPLQLALQLGPLALREQAAVQVEADGEAGERSRRDQGGVRLEGGGARQAGRARRQGGRDGLEWPRPDSRHGGGGRGDAGRGHAVHGGEGVEGGGRVKHGRGRGEGGAAGGGDGVARSQAGAGMACRQEEGAASGGGEAPRAAITATTATQGGRGDGGGGWGTGGGRVRAVSVMGPGFDGEGEGEGSQALARQEGSWLLERASERVKGRGRGPGRAWVGRVLDMRG